MSRSLHRYFQGLDSGQGEHPLLVVKAQDVESGEPAVFDRWSSRVTVEQVLASGASLMLFPAQAIDGRYCWDGEADSHSPLRETLNVLQASARRAGGR